MSRCWAGLITVLALTLSASNASATAALFSGSTTDNGGLSASASFTIENGQLIILLTNTDTNVQGAGYPTEPSQVLSGLFFNLGTATFSPVSATLEPGSSIIQTENCLLDEGGGKKKASAPVNTGCAGSTDVGGEFSYASGGAGWLDGTTQGISSSGYLNDNTNSPNFGGTNWDDPEALDGINFGIVPEGWTPGSGNGGLDGVPLIEGTVRFVLDIPEGLTEADITNVYFTYGTSAGDGDFPGETTNGGGGTGGGGTSGSGVPEPAALATLGLGLLALGQRIRNRRRQR